MEKNMTHFCTGIDMGTSRIVCARSIGDAFVTKSSLNAYIQVKDTPATRQVLSARQIGYHAISGVLEIDGEASVPFAQVYNVELKRTMRLGCLNSEDSAALEILTRMTSKLVEPSSFPGSILCFSVPSAPAASLQGAEPPVFMHHRLVLKRMFDELGYQSSAVQEGEAVIYSELGNSQYTGIGISFGAGLVNVAINYFALPVIAFSLERGGDFIDASSAQVTGERAVRIRLLKESQFALTAENRDPANRALHLFYLELIDYVAEGIRSAISASNNISNIDMPLPVVVAGGTSMPPGFVPLFERALRARDLPLEISEVRAARDPLNAVAFGCLEYSKVNQRYL